MKTKTQKATSQSEDMRPPNNESSAADATGAAPVAVSDSDDDGVEISDENVIGAGKLADARVVVSDDDADSKDDDSEGGADTELVALNDSGVSSNKRGENA